MMLELRKFQEETLETLDAYLDALHEQEKGLKSLNEEMRKAGRDPLDYCAEAWKSVMGKESEDYKPRYDGCERPIPNVCLKLPTGGGKTLIAAHAVQHINQRYFKRNTGLVLWVMPSDAIYRQTLKNFKDYDHPYRKVLDRAALRLRAAVLERSHRFTPADVLQNFGVLLLMLQASARESKERLRMFRNSGGFMDFLPPTDDFGKHNNLKNKIKNLDVTESPGAQSQSGGFRPRVVKYSLANVLRILRPIIVIDEGHRAYSDNARDALQGFNPRFILELSATPNSTKIKRSNILVNVSGEELKKEQMIKLPIHLENIRHGDWQQTLSRSYERLKELEAKAQKSEARTDRYIRPILLVRVERTGKDQRKPDVIHAEDAKAYLIKQLGMRPDEVRIKASGKDEIADDDLLSPLCPVRAIITVKALQEGWDCPFAYVLALLDKGTANTALTQMIGRVLRQPYAQATGETDLDMAHVFCFNQEVSKAVENIKKALREEGLGDLQDGDITVNGGMGEVVTIQRRMPFRGKEILIPRVLHGKGKKRRPLDYERDILSGIKWEDMRHRRQGLLLERDTAVREEIIDIYESIGETHKELLEGDVNAEFFARQISDIIPNPWQAYRIAEEVMPDLKKLHNSQELYANRMNIVYQMREDIKQQRDSAAEKLFQNKIRKKDITFHLKTTQDAWKMPPTISFRVPVGKKPKFLPRETNDPLQLGLFEKYSESDFTSLEKSAAWWLDEKDVIKWWHRIVARKEYGLQGWKKHVVYPDFIALVEKKGISKTIHLIETKGKYLLGNDDTTYKEKLFGQLASAARSGKVGDMSIPNAGKQIDLYMVRDISDLANHI